ncbi:MAG TPA: TetR/AcrR family transcriptional regulator, partial [Solirubrobacteraceae bacterium]|nr:TetR/AcrR family transcriptional regulator [Solirubrobacteraceae bacterium]
MISGELTPIDGRLLDGAQRAVVRYGAAGATLERIATEAGVSRMTLHRHGVSRADLFTALAQRLEDEYQRALWPALVGAGSARDRLRVALEAECGVAEANLELLEALTGDARSGVFHEEGAPALTREVYVEPLQRLLADGVADGTLRVEDVEETATVLFNQVGHTYRHLRKG